MARVGFSGHGGGRRVGSLRPAAAVPGLARTNRSLLAADFPTARSAGPGCGRGQWVREIQFSQPSTPWPAFGRGTTRPVGGTTSNRDSPVPVVGITNAVQVSAGAAHACALLASGAVECWGTNSFGELGDGTTTDRHVPVAVGSLSAAAQASAGDGDTCAALKNGTIKCWGYNGFSQFGDGTTTNSVTPVSVSGITTAVWISAGDLSTCAVLADGSVDCWGDNGDGQLGNGTSNGSTVPVAASGISTGTQVTMGDGDDHACSLLSGGGIDCWGFDDEGQVGNNQVGFSIPTPAAVSGFSI